MIDKAWLQSVDGSKTVAPNTFVDCLRTNDGNVPVMLVKGNSVDIGEAAAPVDADTLQGKTISSICNNISDAYDSTSTYSLGDYCIYDNKLYKCTTAIATAEAWTSAHWELTDCGSELKELNSNLESEISNLTNDISSLMVKRTLTFNASNIASMGVMNVQYLIPSGYTPISVKVNNCLWWQVSLSHDGYIFLLNTDGVTKNETLTADIFFVKTSLVK